MKIVRVACVALSIAALMLVATGCKENTSAGKGQRLENAAGKVKDVFKRDGKAEQATEKAARDAVEAGEDVKEEMSSDE